VWPYGHGVNRNIRRAITSAKPNWMRNCSGPVREDMKSLLFAAVLGTLLGRAQTLPTPPAQPASGPGGTDYLFPDAKMIGPFNSVAGSNAMATQYYVFEPAGSTLPASLPVILFLHGGYAGVEGGYAAGDSPSNYNYWLMHLAKMGYTVVFPYYDSYLNADKYSENILDVWEAALEWLGAGQDGVIPPRRDSFGIQTVFVGHSIGATEALTVAQQLSLNPSGDVPLPRAIAAFTPGIGKTGIPVDFSHISPYVRLVIVEGSDDPTDQPTAGAIWASVNSAIPAENRDFLQVISDLHGSPEQPGSHWFPDTNGVRDCDDGLDNRDFNVTWKLSVGLADCVLKKKNCAYGLGHGSEEQIGMGQWSDGQPVIPMMLMH